MEEKKKMKRVTDEGQRKGDGGGVCGAGRRKRREEETHELMETETEGQLLGFETYAWQRERTGRAGDGWEGQRGVTGEEEKMTTAGREHEIEEEEDGEEGRSVIAVREYGWIRRD